MHKTCQWIGSEQTQMPYQHPCSNTTVKATSYCQEHLPLVYRAGSAVRRRRDTRRAEQLQQLIDDFNSALEELESEGWTPEWRGEIG